MTPSQKQFRKIMKELEDEGKIPRIYVADLIANAALQDCNINL